MDEYTKRAVENGISRRIFITGAAAAAATLGLFGLAGCAPDEADGTPAGTGLSSDGAALLPFLDAPDPIPDSEIAQVLDFDVVVVGAGAAGVPAALSAAEAGAKVAVLQKENIAISQGNSGTGIDLENSNPAGVQALVSKLAKDNNHRANPALLQVWAENSGEAVKWVIDRAAKGGAQVIDQGNLQQVAILEVNGYGPMSYVTSFFGPKPYTAGDGMRAMATVAEDAGVEFFFSTPGEQLITDADGTVTGVIGKAADGTYIRFNAKKGVILAAGDYQNNKEMSDYFIPDITNFTRKQSGKTGDGHKMAYWAGAVFEPIGHTKMLHDFDGGPAPMCDMPFLAVDQSGKRFINETVEMSVMNNYLRQAEDTGKYAQVFDADYMQQAEGWPGLLVPPEGLKNYMPEENIEHHGVFETFIGTYKADTLEELAEKIEMDPATFVASVERYNELVAAGVDSDFGKPAEYLKPVVKAPFYAIRRRVRLSAICAGMVVDTNSQCLDADGEPIKGLFAIGNQAGGFYGGVDYPLSVFGLSLGRCYTFGYLAGKYVAGL